MPMAVPTPYGRVRNSGFRWPIGQKDPGQGQNYAEWNCLAQRSPVLTLKTLFSARVGEQRLSPSPMFL